MNRKRDKDLQAFFEEVYANVDAGHQAFVADLRIINASGSLSGATIAHARKSEMVKEAKQVLLDEGLNIRGITDNDWDYTVRFEIEVPAAVEATKTCPMCAETVKEAALVCRFCGHNFA